MTHFIPRLPLPTYLSVAVLLLTACASKAPTSVRSWQSREIEGDASVPLPEAIYRLTTQSQQLPEVATNPRPACHDSEEVLCDGLDNDCDGTIDEHLLQTFYPDCDRDGFGDLTREFFACSLGLAQNRFDGLCAVVRNGSDCNDDNPAQAPNHPELCDALDNDCDGLVDEGVKNAYFVDEDGDGFGATNTRIEACEPPHPNFRIVGGDCQDGRSDVFPGATVFHDAPYQTLSGTWTYDYDCSGEEDPELLQLSDDCHAGWAEGAIAWCGTEAAFVEVGHIAGRCTQLPAWPRRQSCR